MLSRRSRNPAGRTSPASSQSTSADGDRLQIVRPAAQPDAPSDRRVPTHVSASDLDPAAATGAMPPGLVPLSPVLTRVEAAAFCRVSLRTFERHVQRYLPVVR